MALCDSRASTNTSILSHCRIMRSHSCVCRTELSQLSSMSLYTVLCQGAFHPLLTPSPMQGRRSQLVTTTIKGYISICYILIKNTRLKDYFVPSILLSACDLPPTGDWGEALCTVLLSGAGLHSFSPPATGI